MITDPVAFVDATPKDFEERADVNALAVAGIEAIKAEQQANALALAFEDLLPEAITTHVRRRFRTDMRAMFPPEPRSEERSSLSTRSVETSSRNEALSFKPAVSARKKLLVRHGRGPTGWAGAPEMVPPNPDWCFERDQDHARYKAELASRLAKARLPTPSSVDFKLPSKQYDVMSLANYVARLAADDAVIKARTQKCPTCGSVWDDSHWNCTLAPAYKHTRRQRASRILHGSKPWEPLYRLPSGWDNVPLKPHVLFPPAKPIPEPNNFAMLEGPANRSRRKWTTPSTDRKSLAALDKKEPPLGLKTFRRDK